MQLIIQMKMKMNYKEINTLEQLRAAKLELKQRMKSADQDAKEGFLYKTVNQLFNKVEDNSATFQSPVGSGVNSALNFISNQAQSRFNMGKTTKTLLSLAVVVAAPIIAKKVQDLIDKKL